MDVVKHLALGLAVAAGGTARPADARRLAPIAPAQAVSTHGPFEMGACEACHAGPKGGSGMPGPVLKRTNALCFDCHDDYQKPMKSHPSPSDTCTVCHSPHNSAKKKLLTR